MKKETIIEMIESKPARSAWDKGVKYYALDLLDGLETDELNLATLGSVLLNGAKDWSAYSYGGCALIYDTDIAETLCSPSELKRKDDGRLRPNRQENWLDVQARALFQAFLVINRIVKRNENN